MRSDDVERVILALQERRCQLDAARVEAVARLNSILGGIAEMEYLIDTVPATLAGTESVETVGADQR